MINCGLGTSSETMSVAADKFEALPRTTCPVVRAVLCLFLISGGGSINIFAQSDLSASGALAAKTKVVASLRVENRQRIETRKSAAFSDSVECDSGDTKRQSKLADDAAKSENKNAEAEIVSARNDSGSDQTSSATEEARRDLMKDGLRLSMETRYSEENGQKSCSLENK
jgi:hypothetical protein